jgi:8-oxo-dGTP diphosphatase
MNANIDSMFPLETFPLRYTLCFLHRKDELLMLLRNKPPNQGLWNGVGGRLEKGETPYISCLREIKEETGYTVQDLKFHGLLTWQGIEIERGGLYVFSAPAPQVEPIQSDEGLLAWKKCDWVFSSSEVVSNIHHFGPALFERAQPCIHHFIYHDGKILSYQQHTLPAHFMIQ